MAGTCLSPDVLREYQRVTLLVFASATDFNADSDTHQDAGVTDADTGYVDELERAGQHATTIGDKTFQEKPYTSQLRLCSDAADLYNLKGIPSIVESVTFFAIDATTQTPTLLQTDADTYQDPVVVADMIASQATDMDANVASHFRNGIAGNWQPNWFRPEVYINDENLLPNLAQSHAADTNGNKNHRGDMSIGLPLPWEMDFARRFENGIGKVRVFAQVVQCIPQTGQPRKFVRYPVVCIVKIRTKLQ